MNKYEVYMLLGDIMWPVDNRVTDLEMKVGDLVEAESKYGTSTLEVTEIQLLKPGEPNVYRISLHKRIKWVKNEAYDIHTDDHMFKEPTLKYL